MLIGIIYWDRRTNRYFRSVAPLPAVAGTDCEVIEVADGKVRLRHTTTGDCLNLPAPFPGSDTKRFRPVGWKLDDSFQDLQAWSVNFIEG